MLLLSCNNKKDVPDVSNIPMDVSILRFDKDFFALDTLQVESSLTAIETKYPAFLTKYFKYFAPVKEMAQQRDISFDTALIEYYRFMNPLAVAAANKYATLDKEAKGLEEALRFAKYYFPSFKQPVVLTSVESLNPENPGEINGTSYFDDTLVISLQMFLGRDYPAYNPSLYPDYIRRRFEPEFIVPNSVRAVVEGLYPDANLNNSLIEQMIEKGKHWWLMKKLMPEVPDSLITGYTAQQTKDIAREEGNIWGLISKNQDLYTIDVGVLKIYLDEGPFTATLPQGAPGKIGPWIGWRIIEKFEQENPKLSVADILKTPAKKIFSEAHYRP